MKQDYNMYSVELDIQKMLKRLLIQWRAMVAIAIVFGVLLMLGKFAVDLKNYQPQIAIVEPEPLDIEAAKEQMSAEQYASVLAALQYQNQINELVEYTDNSLLMNINALSYNKLKMNYQIKSTGVYSSSNIVQAYKDALLSDKVLADVLKDLEISSKPMYVREILTVSDVSEKEDMDGIQITFMLPEDVDENQAKDAIVNAVNSTKKTLNENGYIHEINFLSESVSMESDGTIRATQQNNVYQLLTMITFKSNEMSSFSAEQTQLYNAILEEQNADKNTMKKTPGEVTYIDNPNPAPSLGKRYFAMGFLVAIVLYVAFYFAFVIFSPVVREQVLVSNVKGLPTLGLVNVSESKVHRFLKFMLCDNLMSSLIYKNELKYMTVNDNILGNMQVYSHEPDMKKFQIIHPGEDLSDATEYSEFLEFAKMKGFEVSSKNVDLKKVKETIQSINVALPTVLAIYEGKTRKKDIRNLCEIFANQNMFVVGGLYLKKEC